MVLPWGTRRCRPVAVSYTFVETLAVKYPSTSLLMAVSTMQGSLVAPGARVYSTAPGAGGGSLRSCDTKSIEAPVFAGGVTFAACCCAGCTMVVPEGRFFRAS